ncbi:MAG: neutral/alkaline non-lysosomal ceramidase N-terminal domain-containing protein [Actinobacteria bacterium]|nr:neutral/alkaline non-lysosomal ceramidase N-terminal domain-containing protein [Actinomycetota bacterium]
MGGGITRRDFLRLSAGAGAAAGAMTLVPPVTRMAQALQAPGGAGPLRAGTGVTDLTPGNGGTFFGYVRPDRTANGVAVRLFARALVLDDGQTRLALLTVDLGASLDKAGVVERLADLGYSMDTVMLAGTHTHAGPEEWTDWLEEQMAEAVRRAHADLGPAVGGMGAGIDRGRQHEPLARGAPRQPRPGRAVARRELSMDPAGPDHPRDLNIRLLRVERPSGEPVTGWGLFAVHPTNFPNTNTVFSGDLSGLAVRRFEASFGSGAGAVGVPVGGSGVPLGVLTNSNEGDLMSLYESYNPHSCADLMGIRLGRKLRELWDSAGSGLRSNVPLGHRWTRIRYQGQEVEPGRPVANRALWGVSFLGGAENGPTPWYEAGLEGTRRPAELADPVHGRKVIAGPAPWRTDPELQLLRIGPTLLTALPGEATTEAGRRINAAALDGAPDGVDDAAVVGLANDFVGYFTTQEEYNQQHYEGGHTVFGQWTTLLVVRSTEQLSGALASGEEAPPPNVDPLPEYPPPGGEGGGVGGGAAEGQMQAQPPCDVPRMGVADLTWGGGPDGLDRPVGAPFVILERRTETGTWDPVDSDLGVAFHWTEEDGRYLARHEIAADQTLGTYRFRITAARYELATEPFEVVPNDGLIVRGVEMRAEGSGSRLLFRVQNPPPEVREHLRYREQVPAGGTLTFRYQGGDHVATWDGSDTAYVAVVDGDAPGADVEVPAGGLRGAHGNHSGEAGTFTVGEVAELRWPPDMAVGGTDRDWHGHSPSEVEVGRAGDCPAGSPEGSGGSGDDRADGPGGSTSDGASTPATGGGRPAAGALAVGAALAAGRAMTRADRH